MVPCYRRITEFLRAHGVRIFIVDSDGNTDALRHNSGVRALRARSCSFASLALREYPL